MLSWRLDSWFLEKKPGEMEVTVLNRHKMLMMLSVVLMASALTLIIFNFTGAMEYSKKNIIVYAWLFALGVFFFIQNMKRGER